MRKDIRYFVEAEIRNYHETKNEYNCVRADLYGVSAIQYDGMETGGNGGPSSPTESAALILVTNKRLKRMEETLRSIDKIIVGLDPIQLQFIQLYYWGNKYTLVGIAQMIGCSKRTLQRWRDKICEDLAVEMGLRH